MKSKAERGNGDSEQSLLSTSYGRASAFISLPTTHRNDDSPMKTLSLTFITSIRSAHPLASARDLASDRTHGRGPLRFSPSFACATITLCRQLHHTAPWHFPSKTKDFHQGGSTHLQIRSQSQASPAPGCFNPETLSIGKFCGEICSSTVSAVKRAQKTACAPARHFRFQQGALPQTHRTHQLRCQFHAFHLSRPGSISYYQFTLSGHTHLLDSSGGTALRLCTTRTALALSGHIICHMP